MTLTLIAEGPREAYASFTSLLVCSRLEGEFGPCLCGMQFNRLKNTVCVLHSSHQTALCHICSSRQFAQNNPKNITACDQRFIRLLHTENTRKHGYIQVCHCKHQDLWKHFKKLCSSTHPIIEFFSHASSVTSDCVT